MITGKFTLTALPADPFPGSSFTETLESILKYLVRSATSNDRIRVLYGSISEREKFNNFVLTRYVTYCRMTWNDHHER